MWRKAGSGHLKCHLDSAAWILSDEIDAKENCAICYGRLVALSGEINVRPIELLSLFDPHKALFVEKMLGQVT